MMHMIIFGDRVELGGQRKVLAVDVTATASGGRLAILMHICDSEKEHSYIHF